MGLIKVLPLIFIFIFIFIFITGCQVTADSEITSDKPSFSAGVLLNSTDDKECPVGLVSGLTLDEEFGPGTSDITRCLHKDHIKVVYQLNKTCRDDSCSKPYALGNIQNAIKDYEITHGLVQGRDFDIVAVAHSGGYGLVLANDAEQPFPEENLFQAQVESLIEQGVRVYFCQNTARNKGIVTANLIPGVKYVTAGVTAITDFQLMGYAYLQP